VPDLLEAVGDICEHPVHLVRRIPATTAAECEMPDLFW
jgi:hypothetical protein